MAGETARPCLPVGAQPQEALGGSRSPSGPHFYPRAARLRSGHRIAALGSGGRADAVSRAVIQLAHDLYMKTVAEGVEAADQIHLLRLLGCDLAQGYHFSRPLAPDELLPLLEAIAPFAEAVTIDRTRLALVS